MMKRVMICMIAMTAFLVGEIKAVRATSVNMPLKPEPLSLYILQGAAHPALDETRRGIIETFEQHGFVVGETLDATVDVAQGSLDLAASMVNRVFYAPKKPRFVVGIGTTVSQILLKHVRAQAGPDPIQLVFSSVTDPQAAGLVQSLNQPGNNTSGVSNFVDLEPQLAMIQKLIHKPHSSLKIGVVYNPAEVNSVAIVEKLKVLCLKLKMTLITAAAQTTDKVAQAAMKLRQEKIDACFLHNDNTVLSAAGVLFQRLTDDAHIPVVAGDNDMVARGALFALGPNQRTIGAQTAMMMINAMKQGVNLGIIPVQFPEKTELHLNLEAAKKTGIAIPEAIRLQAAHVIDKSQP